MPTTRPRHMITETDEVQRLLAVAGLVWPDLRNDRAELIRQLLRQGADSVQHRADEARAERRKAIRETAGIFTGMYPPGEAARLKEEWPE